MVSIDSSAHLAQRYLASAYDSVANLIETTYPILRSQREGSRGRLTHAEQDLFRAATVFAGAGVDAVLKEALRSCVPERILTSRKAREKYEDFVTKHIQTGGEVRAKTLAGLLIHPAPREVLLEAFV